MKKVLKIIGISLLLIFLFKGFFYRQTIHYTPIKERKSIPLTNQKIITLLKSEVKNKQLNLQEIANIATKITTNQLTFTFQKAAINPNKIAATGKATCVGYAAFFSAVANHLIKEAKLQDHYQVRHLVGHLDFLGVDLHQFFTHSFYQNHDYNQIKNIKTRATIYIDPSISDYLWIHEVSSN